MADLLNTQIAPLQALINPFQFSGFDIRTAVDENSSAHLCAKDICTALDISWTSNTLRNMPKRWVSMIKLIMESGAKDTLFLSEPGFYRLVLRSNKPKAVEFSNWVCEEVLPALRKQGFFGTVSIEAEIKLSNLMIKLLGELQKTKDAFARELLMGRLRDVCNILGMPIPNVEIVGQDYRQMLLPGLTGGES